METLRTKLARSRNTLTREAAAFASKTREAGAAFVTDTRAAGGAFGRTLVAEAGSWRTWSSARIRARLGAPAVRGKRAPAPKKRRAKASERPAILRAA
jgi:hypothetical protein